MLQVQLTQGLVSLESLQVVVRTKSICLVGAKSDKIWWWRPNREFHRHAHRPSEAMHSVKSRDSSVTLCASMTSWHWDITTLRLCASLTSRHWEPDTDIVQDSTSHSLTPIWVHQGATQSLSWTCKDLYLARKVLFWMNGLQSRPFGYRMPQNILPFLLFTFPLLS